jgi:UDP-N-acetyl-D-glucosamine dehydrogenase
MLEKIRAGAHTIGVIGLGYVGLPLACAATRGAHKVVGLDVHQGLVASLNSGKSHVEAISDERLAEALANGLTITTDAAALEACDVVLICVPTPLTAQREPDLGPVLAAGRTIAAHARSGSLVVLESTTYPLTTKDVLAPLLQAGGKTFHVGFSPEREDPGNHHFSTVTIPKIVSGEGPVAAELVQAVYDRIVQKTVLVKDTATAEAIKILENTFRAVNIGLINEMKVVFDAMGIDVWEVVAGAATKPFGFMPFYPGPGLGGHCIPIDPFYLTWKAREFGQVTRMIETAGDINRAMPDYVVAKTREAADMAFGKGLRTTKILVLGLTYKPNIADVRHSPAVEIAEKLLAQGALLDYIDPHVPTVPHLHEAPLLSGKASVASGDGYDLAIVLTPHKAFDYKALLGSVPVVVDTRNAVPTPLFEGQMIVKA